jgi:glycosyltransferase involved in cell wall biosynthesis
MIPRVAVIQSHPIQYFAPLFREVSRRGEVVLRVLFCSDWGLEEYRDPGFGVSFRWDIDLVGGYDHELLPIARKPKTMMPWELDNPTVGEALARFRPDVIELSGYVAFTNWRALAWARRHDVRVMFVSDSELIHPRRWPVRLAKELFVRGFFSQLDGALPIGSANAAYYRHYGLPAALLHPCPIPTDGARFRASEAERVTRRAQARAELGLGEHDFVFGTVGKLVARKRHDDVIRALLALPPEVRARRRVRVLVVGEGEERPRLEALARQANGAVVLSGFANQSRMPALYAALDALVVASDEDPYGLVASEALFAALPILASDRVGCVGPASAVRPDENGFVFPARDVAALAAVMARLLASPEATRRMGDVSLALSEEHDVPFAAERFARAAEAVATRPLPTFTERLRRATGRVSVP